MKIIEGGNYSYTRGVSSPIVVSEDTEWRLANFCQQTPHTAIFDVAPGVVVRFVDCNLVNVTVPDGAEIIGGNLAHVIRTKTGNEARPFVNLLCECEKCSAAQGHLADCIEGGVLPLDKSGRILHHAMKDEFRERRGDKDVSAFDMARQAEENAAALAKWEV